MDLFSGEISFIIGRGGMYLLAIATVCAILAAGGLGIINAFLLRRAYATRDHTLLRFLRQNSRAVVPAPFLASLVVNLGAWFWASRILPNTTSALVHLFMWLFAIQGVIYIVQGTAAYAYDKGWERIAPPQHLMIGWIYAIGGAATMLVMSTIVSFMVTPGAWLTTYNSWDALINPTLFPTLAMSAAGGIALGSVLLILMASLSRGFTDGERNDLEGLIGRWLWALAVAFLLVPLCALAFPHNRGVSFTPFIVAIATATSAGAYFIIALVGRRERIGCAAAVLNMGLLLIAVISLFVGLAHLRGPYTIRGYIFSNDIAVSDAPRIQREGILSRAHNIVPPSIDLARVPGWKRGEWVFKALRFNWYFGTNGSMLRKKLNESDAACALYYIQRPDLINPSAPPFIGSLRERNDLVDYLSSTEPMED